MSTPSPHAAWLHQSVEYAMTAAMIVTLGAALSVGGWWEVLWITLSWIEALTFATSYWTRRLA